MPFITREDGEHFVIPSYRDVLTARNKNQLKKDILLLSQSYGNYITLQRKTASQYEVAFSPDTGYLLGESIWHYFKRPVDMIYCEAIPNTTEALLVIVKAGSVYLDGSFPTESIPEELVIFLTQQNNFEIYVYGDVPISHRSEEGKFSFEEGSVKSFVVLEKPVFPTVPLLKIYQLRLVDTVLKEQGIGVFPTRQLLTIIALLGAAWVLYSYFTAEAPVKPVHVTEVNPYQEYNKALTSPPPDQELSLVVQNISKLFTLPGWSVNKLNYETKILTAQVKSKGGKIADLSNWTKLNNAKLDIIPSGINVVMNVKLPNRMPPRMIYSLRDVVTHFVDNLASVYPGNHLSIGEIVNKGAFLDMTFTINVDNVSPLILSLIAQQMKDLPFVLKNMDLSIESGNLTGSIQIEALGSQL